MNKIKVCIMAGGAGTRFWPMSTEEKPKQFIDILKSGQTLLQATYERALLISNEEGIYVLTHARYKNQVAEQLPQIQEQQILCETERKNTAAALAYAGIALSADSDDFVMVVLSADHIIRDSLAFRDSIQKASVLAARHKQHLFPLGIHPDKPHTGYGYLEIEKEEEGVLKVARFKEKPDMETAVEYVNSGRFLWNSGIFVWHIQGLLTAFKTYAPDILEAFVEHSPNEAFRVVRNESIDYAVMEKSPNIYTLSCDFGWDDLGTYSALHQMSEKDEFQNAAMGGQVLLEETKGTLVLLPDGTEAIIRGLENYIVCLDGGKLLIYPMSEEQSLKQSLSRLN
jgi:mannose-1-phosphate guanylyltransferase